jgi:ubiquinone/menaquinone biosynthesis C-methylase UbiE
MPEPPEPELEDVARRRKIAAHQRRRFNELAESFDAPQPEDVMTRLGYIVAAAGLRPGAWVLDAGAGTGILAPLIGAYRPGRILACDLSENMLRRLRQRHPEVLAIQCDVLASPVAAGTLDAIFMNAMFGNLADRHAACREAARMLRTGGRLIISHPEGRAYVEHLRMTTDLIVDSLPDRHTFQELVTPFGMELTLYQDEPKLYLAIATRRPLTPV